MKFQINKILTIAKDDYEKAWLDTSKYLKKEGHIFKLKPEGKAHPVNEFMATIRNKMIELGFEEIILPTYVDEEEVYKEYGPEAALILDRLYYLAELPRPEIGVSQKKINIIHEILPSFDKIEQLQTILRRYKKGEIEADNLVEVMIEELNLEESYATAIIEKAFPEFKEMKPLSTKLTLRSHITALWFPVLAEIYKKKPLPLQYFLVGPKWRREQKVDETHLICSNGISIVVMADEITLEDVQDIARQITNKIGFKNVKIEMKKATSKYYAPQMEFEIFVEHPTTKRWIEIGDGGFYSPVSLAKFNIDRPTINIGFGVERIVMILTGESDIRRLTFPYSYSDVDFTDAEIVKLIRYEITPQTEEGKEIVKNFIKIAIAHENDAAPVEQVAWCGVMNEHKVTVKIWDKDPGAKLLGKAARNDIWVEDGNIICRAYNTTETTGLKTKINFLEGIANEIAAKAEELCVSNETPKWSYRIRIPRHPSELNIHIDDKIRFFINSKKKHINVRGPVFVGIDIEIEQKNAPQVEENE